MCNRVKPPTMRQLKNLLGDGFTLDGFDDIDTLSMGYDHGFLPAITDFYTPTMTMLEWGLISHKCTSDEQAAKLQNSCLNARAESIFETWSYKDIILSKRCIVLVQGFIEYQHEQPGKAKTKKQPFYVDLKDSGMMPLAGVWDVWRDKMTCSIITTPSNPLMSTIHNSKERQPHIIEQQNWEDWLGPLDRAGVEAMLSMYPDDNMKAAEFCMDTPKPPASTGGLF